MTNTEIYLFVCFRRVLIYGIYELFYASINLYFIMI